MEKKTVPYEDYEGVYRAWLKTDKEAIYYRQAYESACRDYDNLRDFSEACLSKVNAKTRAALHRQSRNRRQT